MSSDNRIAIRNAAFKLFRECGYRLTSYSKIAETCGLGRPLVQYYFPKKEDLATEFVLSILRETSALVEPAEDPLVNVTLLGQVYYSFLLSDENMKRLTLDLLSSRQVTGRVTAVNAEYTIPPFADMQQSQEILRHASIRATGGIYELLFIGLENGQPFDPGKLSTQNTAAFAAMALGHNYDTVLKDLENQLLSTAQVASICKKLSGRIFA